MQKLRPNNTSSGILPMVQFAPLCDGYCFYVCCSPVHSITPNPPSCNVVHSSAYHTEMHRSSSPRSEGSHPLQNAEERCVLWSRGVNTGGSPGLHEDRKGVACDAGGGRPGGAPHTVHGCAQHAARVHLQAHAGTWAPCSLA